MTWIVFCNTPSGERLSREVQKYHTHNIIYEHPLHSIVMLQLDWENSSLSMLQSIIVLPSNFGVIVRIITLFVYLWTCVCVFLWCIVVEFVCVAPVGRLITLPVSAHLPLPWAPSQLAPPSSTSDPFNIFTQHVFVCVCLSLSLSLSSLGHLLSCYWAPKYTGKISHEI